MTASLQHIHDAVREAVTTERTLRITGAGEWLNAGRPVVHVAPLMTGGHTGIVEYVPGDFTITVRGGTSLAEIDAAAHAHGQWLALDPCGTQRGTIGATIATASSGPLAHAFGLPRDQVLGVEVVTGTGEIVRVGGRVVKNVAGFDLTRLMTGSWGTLGVITEVSLRLRARPAHDITVALDLPDSGRAIDLLCTRLRREPVHCYAMELLNHALAERLGLGQRMMLLVRFGGGSAQIAVQRGALAAYGTVREVDGDIWSALRTAEPVEAVVIRYSDLPASFPALWRTVEQSAITATGAFMHGTPSRGMVRLIVPTASDPERCDEHLLAQSGGATRPERLPPAMWRRVPDEATNALSRGMKDVFDPHGILNPGILGAVA